MILSIIFMVVGIAFIGGSCFFMNDEKSDKNLTACFFIIGLIAMAGSAASFHFDGKGLPARFSVLEKHGIYLVMSSVSPEKLGKGTDYLVSVKSQNGEIITCLLDQNPPKVFKVEEDSFGKNIYNAFPSIH